MNPPSPAPATEVSTAGAPPEKGVRRARRQRQVRELGVLLAVVVLIVTTWMHNPGFLSPQGVRDLFLGATVLSVLANGLLVTTVQVPALVVTLGTLYAYRGLGHWWADGGQINAHDMPDAFLYLGRVSVLGVPLPAAIAALVIVVVGFYLARYRSGRELYAVGSNVEAARLSGIPVGSRVMTAFVVNGALAGLAGVLFAARYGTVDSTVGFGMELQVVAAAVVGGVAIAGGVGTVYGAALGAILLTTITAALPIWQINQFWHQAVVGALILAAISLDRLLSLRAARKLRGGGARGA